MRLINLILALPLLLLGISVSSSIASLISDHPYWMLAVGLGSTLLLPVILASWLRGLTARRRPDAPAPAGEDAARAPGPRRRWPSTFGTVCLINLVLVAGCVALAPGITRAALDRRGAWWARRAAVLLGYDEGHPVAEQTDRVVRELASWIPRAEEGDGPTPPGADLGAGSRADGGGVEPPDAAGAAAAADGLTAAGGEIRVPFQKKGSGIVVPVTLLGPRGAVPVKMLFDTGATLTTVDNATLTRLGLQLDPEAPSVLSHTANGQVRRVLAVIDGAHLMGARVDGGLAVSVCDPCAQGEVVGLLGLNFSKHFKVTVDHDGGEVLLAPKERPVLRTSDIHYFVKLEDASGLWHGDRLTVDLQLRNLAPRALRQVKVAAEIKSGEQLATVAGVVAAVPARGRVPLTIKGSSPIKGTRFTLRVVEASW